MTDRRDDLVDAFLADLGAADAPAGLAAGVLRAVRDERPPRVSRAPAWLAAAAVLATAALALTAVAWIVAGPGPSPTPVPSVPPAATPSVAGTPSPTPAGSPIPAPSPTPIPQPEFESWFLTVNPGEPDVPVEVQVVDQAGTMTGVAQATVALPLPGPEDPRALDIGPGHDVRSLTVGWIGGVCDSIARLELGPDGHSLALRKAPGPSCDAMGVGFAVELQFKDPVDPAAFSGTWAEDLVTPADIDPHAIAFRDWQHGFVAGQTARGSEVILETADGGATWRVEGIGFADEVTDLGVTADGRAWAGLACPEEGARCRSGFYRYDEGLWGRVDDARPVSLSFNGRVGAGLFLVAGGPRTDSGMPIPELRLMDEGEAWTTVVDPCPTTMTTQDISRPDASTVVVLCESEGATGSSTKELHRSSDGGRTWTRFADGPYTGTLMHMDLLADGTGWMWGTRSPLLATTDGGATWTPLDIADGDVRTVSGARAMGGGAGVVLVRDPDKQATFLLRTVDGRSWTELFAWPAYCCGG